MQAFDVWRQRNRNIAPNRKLRYLIRTTSEFSFDVQAETKEEAIAKAKERLQGTMSAILSIEQV
jgi:hypothetical protein